MTARFDRIAAGRLEVELLPAPGISAKPRVNVKAAFVSTATGRTHGWTTYDGPWSQDTLDKLSMLRKAIERDLHTIHFDDQFDDSQPTPEPKDGLAEFLGEGSEVPEV